MRVLKICKITIILIFAAACSFAAPAGAPPVVDLENAAKKTIVIDAAHGGADWGVAASGLYEKDITLKLAKKIKEKILETKNEDIKVLLTREEDKTMPTADRVGLANAAKAQVFISIHCDYDRRETVTGYKIYYYGGKKQSVAPETETMPEWGNVQKKYPEQNLKFAKMIEKFMKAKLLTEKGIDKGDEKIDEVRLKDRGMAEANPLSVNGVDMPAVVFETGNLNTKIDSALLRDDGVLNSVATHIKEALLNYVLSN